MNLHEFLTHPDVQLPVRWNNHKDFEAFIDQRLGAFLGLVDQLDPNAVSNMVKNRKPSMINCCDSLRKAVRFSFEGHLPEAYRRFDSAIQEILPEINTLAFDVNGPNTLKIMYRVRITQTPTIQRNDLFHIPFELRHLVATQRYSIPGLPCLYLSGSLLTCWEEMGRPPLHELQCSAFWVKDGKQLKLLNLSNRPSRLALYATPPGTVPSDPSDLSAHIVLWPLVFMSSIVVTHRGSPFKPEYVIPQMVLQWVTHNQSFNGLVFFSTHVRAICKKHPMPPCNVVLPAKTIAAQGRCAFLCDTFKMTDPYNWQLLSSINVGEGTDGTSVPMFDIEFIDGIEEPYYKTEFGMVQTKLNKLARRTMFQNGNGEPLLGDISIT